MTEKLVQQTVSGAVGRAYDDWAAEHPSLAAVIDRIALTEQVVESLRDSEEYREAIAAYQRGLSETDLLSRLAELAGPIVTAALGG